MFRYGWLVPVLGLQIVGLLVAAAQGAVAPAYRTVVLTGSSSNYHSIYGYGISAGQQVGTATYRPTGWLRAVLWSGTSESMVDLHPAGWERSAASAAGDGEQAGHGVASVFTSEHALLWRGSAASVVDLHPAGYHESFASDVADGFQVGYARVPGQSYCNHAILWHGSAESAVDLHPAGYLSSYASAVVAGWQAGHGMTSTGKNHALLWAGSSESVVDLHPAGFVKSWADGMGGGQQVGFGERLVGGKSEYHALLWQGSAETAVDLNGLGLVNSQAMDVWNGLQVGSGYGALTGGSTWNYCHALLWAGSAESVMDLHAFLPGTFTQSSARAIDEAGNIFGNAYMADGSIWPVIWQPIPEPTAALLVACAWGGALGWPRRRRVGEKVER